MREYFIQLKYSLRAFRNSMFTARFIVEMMVLIFFSHIIVIVTVSEISSLFDENMHDFQYDFPIKINNILFGLSMIGLMVQTVMMAMMTNCSPPLRSSPLGAGFKVMAYVVPAAFNFVHYAAAWFVYRVFVFVGVKSLIAIAYVVALYALFIALLYIYTIDLFAEAVANNHDRKAGWFMYTMLIIINMLAISCVSPHNGEYDTACYIWPTGWIVNIAVGIIAGRADYVLLYSAHFIVVALLFGWYLYIRSDSGYAKYSPLTNREQVSSLPCRSSSCQTSAAPPWPHENPPHSEVLRRTDSVEAASEARRAFSCFRLVFSMSHVVPSQAYYRRAAAVAIVVIELKRILLNLYSLLVVSLFIAMRIYSSTPESAYILLLMFSPAFVSFWRDRDFIRFAPSLPYSFERWYWLKIASNAAYNALLFATIRVLLFFDGSLRDFWDFNIFFIMFAALWINMIIADSGLCFDNDPAHLSVIVFLANEILLKISDMPGSSERFYLVLILGCAFFHFAFHYCAFRRLGRLGAPLKAACRR